MKPETYYYERTEMFRFIPPATRRLLDVGCGKGRFGSFLKTKMDVEVWGLEMEADVVREAEGKIDRIIVGSIEDPSLALPAGFFDCIVFNDVLEHLLDPWKVLADARQLLAPGGCVVASIPNMRFYEVFLQLILHKKWDYKDAGVLDRSHLRFFTVRTMKEMFLSSGYRVELLKGINYERMPLLYYALNLFTLNRFSDLRYVQYACVARVP